MTVTMDQIRAVAGKLPRASEHLIRDHAKFRVGKIVFLSVAPDEKTMGFGFPKDERQALVDAEPHKFFLPIPSDMRFHWVRAYLAEIDEAELPELIVEAWRLCVPKKVYAEYMRGFSHGQVQ